MHPALLVLLAGFVAVAKGTFCSRLDKLLTSTSSDVNETDACRCFVDYSATTVKSSKDEGDRVWIGCTGHPLPSIFSALRAPPQETFVGKLSIWDSHVSVLPSDIFQKIRPRVVSIERSELSQLREGSFAQLGPRLRVLNLRHNILKRIDGQAFTGLERLQSLDLSGNKLTALRVGDLETVPDLSELLLANNEISEIEDGFFKKLGELKTLSLADNSLTNITRDMFKGLDNLEQLYLQNNQIRHIDWSAFTHLKNLKVLNLGTNLITAVELRGLESLQRLFLNNNSIQSLKNVSIKDMESLTMLSLDRNAISELEDSDLFGLSRSTRLESLSLAANNISIITPRAFQPVQQLTTLSLQNNRLVTLAHDGAPFLRTLKKLQHLFLAGNQLAMLRGGQLPPGLVTLALDHNQISTIEASTFEDQTNLKRLFLNNNNLLFLPAHTFDALNNSTLEGIDLSSNAWQCICGEEWLYKFLDDFNHSVLSDDLGCLGTRKCERDDEEPNESRSVWITIAASVLAAVSLLILVAIAYLYVDEGARQRRNMLIPRPLRRVDSDMLKLINDATANEPLVKDSKSGQENSEKKRVRFDNSIVS